MRYIKPKFCVSAACKNCLCFLPRPWCGAQISICITSSRVSAIDFNGSLNFAYTISSSSDAHIQGLQLQVLR